MHVNETLPRKKKKVKTSVELQLGEDYETDPIHELLTAALNKKKQINEGEKNQMLTVYTSQYNFKMIRMNLISH